MARALISTSVRPTRPTSVTLLRAASTMSASGCFIRTRQPSLATHVIVRWRAMTATASSVRMLTSVGSGRTSATPMPIAPTALAGTRARVSQATERCPTTTSTAGTTAQTLTSATKPNLETQVSLLPAPAAIRSVPGAPIQMAASRAHANQGLGATDRCVMLRRRHLHPQSHRLLPRLPLRHRHYRHPRRLPRRRPCHLRSPPAQGRSMLTWSL